MQTDNEEIKRLADDIRKQAQAALITYQRYRKTKIREKLINNKLF